MVATEEPVAPVKTSGSALRVTGVSHFGANKRGTVVPQWVAEQSGSTAEELVAEGILEWTDELPTGDFRAPLAKTESDPAPAMAEELDRLRRRTVTLEADAKNVRAENDEIRARLEKQLRALGQQTADIAHWKAAADEYRQQVVALQADLDAATAPPVLPDPPAKKK